MPVPSNGSAALVALASLVAACAASVETVPVPFVGTAGPAGDPVVVLARATEVRLATGFTRTLAEGSRWRRVGSVPQGQVYRAVGTVFTIEGRHVHEADLVVTPDRALVGFYLPGEARLSPLPAPLRLTLQELP